MFAYTHFFGVFVWLCARTRLKGQKRTHFSNRSSAQLAHFIVIYISSFCWLTCCSCHSVSIIIIVIWKMLFFVCVRHPGPGIFHTIYSAVKQLYWTWNAANGWSKQAIDIVEIIRKMLIQSVHLIVVLCSCAHFFSILIAFRTVCEVTFNFPLHFAVRRTEHFQLRFILRVLVSFFCVCCVRARARFFPSRVASLHLQCECFDSYYVFFSFSPDTNRSNSLE